MNTFSCRSIPTSASCHSTRSVDSYLPSCSTESIFLSPTSVDEVISIINSFRNTCSPGDDEVAAFPIKCAVNIIAGPLTHICNRMLLSGVFPSKLKVARVTVLFKGGNKNDPNNYRPISVLPLFSKLAERILYRRLNNFLQAKHLICPNSMAFRPVNQQNLLC